MNTNQLLALLEDGESESLEFKESLSLQETGIQSLVAFANRDGGRVLFGITNDGSLKGVSVGANTIENLANRIIAKTYPSLVAHIEEIKIAGKKVVLVETVGDCPPVIGLYMYSDRNIPLDEDVAADGLRALRRVGRTNQASDIMWLRPEMRSDPKLRIGVRSSWIPFHDEEWSLSGRAWTEEGSASAHEISLSTEPAIYRSSGGIEDLPIPFKWGGGSSLKAKDPPLTPVRGWEAFIDFNMEFVGDAKTAEADFALLATYKDDVGLTWEARRDISHIVHDEAEYVRRIAGRFQRRIRAFPPKRTVQP